MNLIYPIGLPIALSLTAYNAFLTGFIALLKRKDRAGLFYFISNLFIFLWGVGISFMLHNALPASIADSWGTFSQKMALCIPATWLHFVLVYTNKEREFKNVLFFTYGVMFLIFPFTFTGIHITGFHEIVEVNRYPIPGPSYYAFTVFFVIVVMFSFWVFYKAIREENDRERKLDLKLVCFSSLYGFAMGSLSFLPVYGIRFPQYNLLLMPVWQVLLAYAMIRHRAFDLVKVAEAAQKDKLAAIGTLASSINHEIRNPLYVIQGLAESHLINYEEGIYANPQTAVDKANDILKRIREHAGRAMEIMKNFALFARQNPAEANVSSISLNDVLNGVFPLVRHEMDFEKIEFVKNIPQGLSPVRLDIRQGEEIFFNLIVNACQAIKRQAQDASCEFQDETPDSKKGGRIEISASQHNGSVCVVVKDNGPGISARQTSQIFEPFYTTRKEGTGLGLYVTRQLVEKNGGRISVQSKGGQGTSFLLELKRA